MGTVGTQGGHNPAWKGRVATPIMATGEASPELPGFWFFQRWWKPRFLCEIYPGLKLTTFMAVEASLSWGLRHCWFALSGIDSTVTEITKELSPLPGHKSRWMAKCKVERAAQIARVARAGGMGQWLKACTLVLGSPASPCWASVSPPAKWRG